MITIGFKQSSDSWLRAILALGLGIVVLITCLQGSDPFKILVKVCGCFVLAAGIFSLIYGLIKKNDKDFSLMMVNAAVDILLGAACFIFAGAIARVFFYLIAFVMIAFGIWQMIVLISARKWVKTGFLVFILPIVIVLLGVLMMAPNISKALGWICSIVLILYGVSELITLYKMRKAIKAFEISITPVEEPAAPAEPAEPATPAEDQKPDDQDQI